MVVSNQANIEDIKNSIREYYSNLFDENDKSAGGVDKPYFFDMMKDITNIDTENNNYKFNQFIKKCFNLDISESNADGVTTTISNIDTTSFNSINEIHSHINAVSIIIDIIDAYKNFINVNRDYKDRLLNIIGIKLKYSSINSGIIEDNQGNYLSLNINSYEGSGDNDLILKDEGTGIAASAGIIAIPAVKTYVKEGFSYSNFTDSDSYYTQNSNIIKNLIYFLLNISNSAIKIEIYTLYYYFNIVKCYMLLSCASTNIGINDIGSSVTNYTTYNCINLTNNDNSSVLSGVSTKQTLYTNDNSINKKNKDELIAEYITVKEHVFNRINYLQKGFFIDNNKFDNLDNKIFNFKIKYSDSININRDTIEIKLDFLNLSSVDDKDAINNIYNNEDQRKFLIKYYYLYDKINNKYFKIKGLSQNKITIEAKYYTNTQTNYSMIPSLPSDITVPTSESSRDLNDLIFIKSNFVTLKKDFYDNKNTLYNINNNIKTNSLKLNSLKHKYEYNKNLDDNLNNQINAIYAILAVLGIVFIGVIISNIDEKIKRSFTMIFGGIILLLIIIFYILNRKNKIEEGFGLNEDLGNFNKENKHEYILNQLIIFNNQSKLFINLLKTHIKSVDSLDLYNDLFNIMNREKRDKGNISDVLAHKKSVGSAHIDVFKYEYHNKQVFINTLLFSTLCIISLYMLYNMNQNIDSNLIMFLIVLLTIIILTYYLINTNSLVHTKSSQYYWGPMNLNEE